MKLSPVQLEAYALTDVSCRANQEHKPDQPVSYREEDIVINHKSERDPSDDRLWKASLSVNIQPRAEANAPYCVSVQLSALVRALPQLETKDIETLMRVNGASLLYGVAREVVRQVTSIGPYAPLLIPSVTFRPDPPADRVQSEAAATSAATSPPAQ